MKGIKWYYETYRPEEYKCHNEKRDWSKNCRISRRRVLEWMIKFKRTGYHRPNKIKQIGQVARPEDGINRLQPITLTECQKNMLVQTCIENTGTLSVPNTVKARV